MKLLLVASVLVMSSMAHAGFPPRTSCSNEGGTIKISEDRVSVLVSTYPSERYEALLLNDLDVTEQVVQQMPPEKFGCTSRSVVFKQIALTKKDGSQMPNASNRLVQNGSLNDYFICATSQAWMPAPGQSCN